MDLARLAPQPNMITAKNADNAENEKLLLVFFAFFAARICAR
jgi:hypothetical protein